MGKKDKKEKKSGRGTGIMKKNISFKGCDDTAEEIFGRKLISRGEVVKKISAYIKENELVQDDD